MSDTSDMSDEDTWTETTRVTPIDAQPLPRPSVSFVLQQMSGAGSPQRFVLNASEQTLGRGAEADIHIPSPDLSRLHMKLLCVGDECRVEDLDSSNGCYLNGVKIHSATLRNGDTLQLGSVLFSFYEGSL